MTSSNVKRIEQLEHTIDQILQGSAEGGRRMTEGCMPVPDAVVTIRDLEVRLYAHYIGISTGDSATMLDRDAVTLLINVLDYKMTQWMKMDRMEEMSAMIPRAGIVECSHDD